MDYVRDTCAIYSLNWLLRTNFVCCRLLAALSALLFPILAHAAPADDLDTPELRAPKISGVVPGEFIVRFKSTATPDKKAQLIKKAKVTARDLIKPSARIARAGGVVAVSEQLQVVTVAGDAATAQATLEKDPDVLYVEPNFKTRLFAPVTPNDFEFDSLYALHNTGTGNGVAGDDIKAPEAWSISTGSPNITVAVIDTGIDFFHEDLRANLWTNPREIPGNGIDDDGNGFIDDVHGYDFVSDDADPFDDHFHGTHVSGTIGALGNNGIGVVGVCWQVRLMAVKAFNEQGNGDVASAVGAIHYAVANGARVINASWGLEDHSRALADAVAEAQAAGVIFVAAAGNSHTATAFFPAGYPGVIAVASVNNRDERSNFSNFGAHIALSAPGEQILSTVPDSKYDSISGTSMSAPHVSGAAALILSRHAEFTASQVATILKNTTDFVKSESYIGSGRLNIFKALQIDVPLPDAALSAPSLMKGRVTFQGTASGPRFQKYTLSYGIGAQPTDWTELLTASVAVNNGVLFANFDSSTLNDGTYTFRVEVFNDNGQSARAVVTSQVRNVELSFPLNSDIVRHGSALNLRGTVFGQGRHFSLEWSSGLTPTTWSTKGFAIPSTSEVLDGTLGVFDTTSVAPNEFYSFRLSATNSTGEVQQFTSDYVWLDNRLRPGFPIYLPFQGEYSTEDWRQAKVADLDGDGHKEIIIVDPGNSEGKVARLLVYHDDGTLAWSRDLNSEEPYSDVPTIADVDGDGKLDILVDIGPTFYAFTRDGNTLPGLWPLTLTAKRLGKIVADLDGDGKMEIVALANTGPETFPSNTSLAIYDREGHAIQRWNVPACQATNFTQRLFPVAANMDDDPDLEIVIVGGCNEVMMFDITKSDGPVWASGVAATALNSPIVADIDHDGNNDVIVATWAPPKSSAGVYRFNRFGSLHPGWPVLTDEAFATSPAIGDLNGDGHLEICVAGERNFKLHLIEGDGFEAEGWPVAINTSTTTGSPSIADIDGDSIPDVIYAGPGNMLLAVRLLDPKQVGGIAAWTRLGAPILLNGDRAYSKIPIEGSGGYGFFKSSPLTITDLDGNGKMDLIGASIRDRTYVPIGQVAVSKDRSSLYAWEFDVPAAQKNSSWLEFQHGIDNNGYLPTPKPPPQPPTIAAIDDQVVAVGSPFPPLPLDQFLVFPGKRIAPLTWTFAGQKDLRIEIDANHFARVTAPTPTWEGAETITFTVTDGATFTRSVPVLFSAKLNFIPPIAVDDAVLAGEDELIEIDVIANDLNPIGGPLHLVGVSYPFHGKASVSADGKALYRGETNYFGDDTFTYVVENDAGAKAFGTVKIVVAPVNDLPVAVDDRGATSQDRAVAIDVLANDKDADGDPLSIVSLTAPANGTAVLDNNKVIYQPAANFNGTNTFFYAISDGKSPPQQAKITVVVRAQNNPPIARAQSVVMNRNTTKDIFYKADDLEGDPLTFRIIRPPLHGELFSYPTIGNYTPKKGYSGKDSFSYKASDGQFESNEALVDITILSTNNPPTATSLSLVTRVNQAVSINLAATDPDDDPVTFEIVALPQHGLLVGAGTNYVYTPRLDYLGKDEFTYTISDGMDQTTGKVSLETTDKNTAPGANVKFVKTTPNSPIGIVLSGADAESNPLTFAITTPTKHGTITGDTPYLLYSPEKDYVGPDRLRFTVSDGEFTSDPAAVTISVAPKNTLPVAKNQTITMPLGGPGFILLDATDSDGDPLQAVILKGPKNGRLFGSGTAFSYTPNNNFGLGDSFTYKPWDGRNFGAEAQVRIEQTSLPPNTPPGFDGIRVTTTGSFQLTVTNQIGRTFRIESSADFKTWGTVTNIQSSPGTFLFNIGATNRQIFYRAIQ
jgi:subtilisin family serine protease